MEKCGDELDSLWWKRGRAQTPGLRQGWLAEVAGRKADVRWVSARAANAALVRDAADSLNI